MSLSDLLVRVLRPIPIRKHRLLSPLVPKTGVRRARIHGVWMDLDLSDLIQRWIYLGTYTSSEDALVKRVLHPGATFVDIGANVGYFTALASKCIGPTGRILSIEPNPTAFAGLSRMVSENRMSNCTPMQMGLSDSQGEMTLYQPPASMHNNNSTMNPVEGWTPIRVPVRTLDDCLEEHHIETVDLLKIDVEGHEPKVFTGASTILDAQKIKAIVCEFNDPWLTKAGSSAEQLWDILERAGFVYEQSPGSRPALQAGSNETYLLVHRSMPRHRFD